MARITVVRWRDIPAQVLAGTGRRAAKVVLPERFEQAIDRAAMRAGATGTDAYLEGWRRIDEGEAEGEDRAAATARAARLEAEWDDARLRAAAIAGGREGAATGDEG